MVPTTRPTRRLAVLLGGVALVAVLAAGPVLGVDPVPGPDSPGAADGQGPPNEPPGQAKDKSKPKAPATPITVTGTIEATLDADGRTVYTLTADGATYELGAGPAWFWGDDHPLAGRVGDQVEIAGEIREGTAEIDVETVDGAALREPGKPAWAGGPKSVGERHPGWKAWSVAHPDGKPGNGHGRAGAPGQQKKADEPQD